MTKRVKIRVVNTQYDIIKTVARDIMNWELIEDPKREDWDICWQDFSVSSVQFNNLKPFQKINHFPGMLNLARKNRLAINLSQMKSLCNSEYDFFPNTWLIPRDYSDLKKQAKSSILIVKPEALSQGKGIFLTKYTEELPEKCVVQEYIANPYLIDDLKFDLRIYVLLLGCDPLRIFIYEEGLVRFATEKYIDPMNNTENIYMHLTNYAINKNNPKYMIGNGNQGHKRSLTWLFEYLEENGLNVEELWNKIKDLVIKTLISSQPYLSYIYRSLHPNEISNSMCFELLGFDVLLDKNLKPWLLEVNHSPSFSTDAPLDELIKRMVILDTFNLIGIQAHDNLSHSLFVQTQTILKTFTLGDLKKWKKVEEKKSQKQRTKFEQEIEGGFQKIFPNENPKYEKYLVGARRAWLRTSSNKKTEKSKEERKPTKKKTLLPRVKLKSVDISIKLRKQESPPPNFTMTFYRPAPKFAPKNICIRKRRSNSGTFIKPKSVTYEGLEATEENRSFMRWKLSSFLHAL